MTAAQRKLEPGELVLATHNEGKARELRQLLAPHGIRVVTGGELGLAEPEETGQTFLENARIKAVAAAQATGRPALADDSGLVVHGLDGAPGIHSARWAGPAKDFSGAMQRVLGELRQRYGRLDAAERGAAFVAVLCLRWPDGHEESFEGRVEGCLVQTPRGSGGFGYDPLFVPKGLSRTFGEMSLDEKQALSHRSRALAALAKACLITP